MNTFTLSEMLGRSAPQIDIVDVGAMWLGQDDCIYYNLLRHGHARVTGFEPVQAECDKLNKMGLKGARFLPYFIGDGAERTFHLTRASMTSSLFEPDQDLLKKFVGLAPLHEVVERIPVHTKRLDDIPELSACHLLKIDVQGAELDVFKGAEKLMQSTLCIQTEVNFLPMYKKQALFADVDAYLRSKGFVVHAFYGPQGRAFHPLRINNTDHARINQAMWADMVYVRDFMKFGDMNADDLLRIACLMHDIWGSFDLAAFALQHAHFKGKQGLWQAYMTRLLGKPAGDVPALE